MNNLQFFIIKLNACHIGLLLYPINAICSSIDFIDPSSIASVKLL
ncbi:MAG: hypothetical protein Q8L15_11365 [Methylobacter sp.]|nr:hypothetical protein [Methylobacter sp.]